MTIRSLTAADLPACADILCGVYNNDLWQCRWSYDTAVAYLADFMNTRAFVGFAAVEDGNVIAALFAHEKIWWNNSEVYIEEMFVRPERQGQGVGSALLREVETYVRSHGLAGITLSTNRYAPAPHFYRKNGFSDCGHVLFMAKEMQ